MEDLKRQLDLVRVKLGEGKSIEQIMPFKVYPQLQFANQLIETLVDSGNVLEVGCGGSLTLHYVDAQSNIACIAIDLEESALQYQAVLKEALGSDVEVCRGDAFYLPYKNEAFSAVVSFGLIEHFSKEKQLEIIREMIRASNRHIFIGIPNYGEHSAFRPLYLEHMESHLPCDLESLGEELALEDVKLNGRGVFNHRSLVEQNKLYRKFLKESFPELYNLNIGAEHIQELMRAERQMGPETRRKFGFMEVMHGARH